MSNSLGPYLLGPNDENQGIYTGDARELEELIPSDSVDLIFTDPVYDELDDYRWLAMSAKRILKEDRACLVWCSKVKLPEIHYLMVREGLTYQSTLFYTVQAKQATPIFPYGLIPWTTPCLIFAKGRYQCQPFMPDTFCAGRASQNSFKWQKNTEVMLYWLRSFTTEESVVFDPFTGSGSVPAACKIMGRCWLAFEIETDRATQARRRVRETNPPLPFRIPQPEQMILELPSPNG